MDARIEGPPFDGDGPLAARFPRRSVERRAMESTSDGTSPVTASRTAAVP
jgi:hypothetical protein